MMVIVGASMIVSGMASHFFLLESPRISLVGANYDAAISVKI